MNPLRATSSDGTGTATMHQCPDSFLPVPSFDDCSKLTCDDIVSIGFRLLNVCAFGTEHGVPCKLCSILPRLLERSD